MRIVHVVTRHRRGGAEVALASAVAFERAAGHEVTVIVGADHEPDATSRDFGSVTVLNELVRDVAAIRDLTAFRRLRKTLNALHPEVVHTHQSKAGVLGRLAAPSGAVIVHNVHMASFGPGYGAAASRLQLLAERLCRRRTHVYVFVGSDIRAAYTERRICNRSNSFVVRSPVEIERYAALRSREPGLTVASRKRYGVVHGPVLVTIGSLEPRKRQAMIVERLAPILRRGGTLLVCGAGPSEVDIRDAAVRSGVAQRVQLLGHVSRVDEVLSIADVVIHASRVEGVSQALVQACAAGVPIVATNVEGVSELPQGAVAVTDRTGRQLESVVEKVLSDGKASVDVEALVEWTLERSQAQRAELQAHVEVLVNGNRRLGERRRPVDARALR